MLDNPKFAQAYQRGREHYFDSDDERMTVEQVMQLIAVPDDNGGYQFDSVGWRGAGLHCSPLFQRTT